MNWSSSTTKHSAWGPPFHVSPTANQFDAIDAIELALADYEAMFGHPLAEECQVDVETGETARGHGRDRQRRPVPVLRFEKFIFDHPELHHVRTRGSRRPGRTGHANAGSGP